MTVIQRQLVSGPFPTVTSRRWLSSWLPLARAAAEATAPAGHFRVRSAGGAGSVTGSRDDHAALALAAHIYKAAQAAAASATSR